MHMEHEKPGYSDPFLLSSRFLINLLVVQVGFWLSAAFTALHDLASLSLIASNGKHKSDNTVYLFHYMVKLFVLLTKYSIDGAEDAPAIHDRE